VIDKNPAEARKALEVIRQTAKSSLEELRSMLGVLRNPEDGDAPFAPAPRLALVSDLVRPLDEAGVSVTLNVTGDLREIPSVVDSSAYRIVQEALTNVVRHAGEGAHATVNVRREGGMLAVEVSDDGRGVPDSGASEGHGIAGMRERVAALGGSFDAGPSPDGGFSVTARLPFSTNGVEARA
jgi:signal transduction histidine kinase